MTDACLWGEFADTRQLEVVMPCDANSAWGQ